MKTRVRNFVVKILRKQRKQEAFTLIEMVVVMAIIVMLVMLIVPNIIGTKDSAQKKADQAFKTTLQTQVELYREDTNKLPSGFAGMDKYLSEDQIERANKGFRINADGTVVENDSKTSGNEK
ncbi:competence type IV pilus major pilin ComGC [Lactobacillus corticis]|uniref:Competence protein ComGC n=1 Tax=Lactobacillus corticis TaxID=2201249 RepID=A0A916QGX0_9LACO|nr:prepilin-type N-terminal cleavage/methylation domain-containing protein [Lactobacillus corticis]GFZ27131.1 competence protein ComGC [Lactobacillus corticis]